MPKNWIAIALGINGGPSGGNTSGFVATEGEAETWAEKALNNANIHGVAIAKVYSKAQRVTSPIEFVGVSDLAETHNGNSASTQMDNDF